MAKSLLNKASLLFLFLIPGEFISTSEIVPQNCDGIELKIEITNSSSARPTGSVEAVVTGAEKPIYFFFYKGPEHQMLSVNFALSKIENVDPGTYHCLVVDNKGCSRNTDFKIE